MPVITPQPQRAVVSTAASIDSATPTLRFEDGSAGALPEAGVDGGTNEARDTDGGAGAGTERRDGGATEARGGCGIDESRMRGGPPAALCGWPPHVDTGARAIGGCPIAKRSASQNWPTVP